MKFQSTLTTFTIECIDFEAFAASTKKICEGEILSQVFVNKFHE